MMLGVYKLYWYVQCLGPVFFPPLTEPPNEVCASPFSIGENAVEIFCDAC